MKHQNTAIAGSDGTERFLRDADRSRQDRVATLIEEFTGSSLCYLGDLSFLDFIAVKHERPIAYVEVICRNYSRQALDDMGGVFLKRETYDLAMALAERPLSVKWSGVYFFWWLSDDLYWKEVREIDPIEGTAYDPRGAVNDVEPVVLVTDLHPVGVGGL